MLSTLLINSFNIDFWLSDKWEYLSLNFSNNTLYVRSLISLSWDLNSSINLSFTSILSISCDVKCSKRVNLLSIIWLGFVISKELYTSNRVYNAANGFDNFYWKLRWFIYKINEQK